MFFFLLFCFVGGLYRGGSKMQHTKSDGAEQKGNHLPAVYNVKKKN